MCPIASADDEAAAVLFATRQRPAPVPRGPLPPFDTAGPYQVHTTLPSGLVVPATYDVNFIRGNAWCVDMTNDGGLPFVPGGTSSIHPNRCLTWFIDEYEKLDASAPDRIFQTHAKRDYSHFLMSRGGGFGQQSPADYARLARLGKDYGFWMCHMLTSKDTDAHSQPAQYYINLVQPYLDALLAAGAIDKACHGWELNAFWVPEELATFKAWLRSYLPANVATASHFTSYETSWQIDQHPRADYWNDGFTDELWYQTDDSQNLGTMQAHLDDAMVPASGLQANGVRLVWAEVKANSQFDGNPKGGNFPNEDDGDMYGYGGLCTPGPIACQGGYWNGARRPNGSGL